jgi:hypothetical protein
MSKNEDPISAAAGDRVRSNWGSGKIRMNHNGFDLHGRIAVVTGAGRGNAVQGPEGQGAEHLRMARSANGDDRQVASVAPDVDAQVAEFDPDAIASRYVELFREAAVGSRNTCHVVCDRKRMI